MFDLSPYYVVLIPLVVGSFIHAIKFIIFFVRHDYDLAFAWEHGTTYGHMPSSHTGFVISLITSVGYYAGLSSGAFAVSVALAILIIDDAIRLRMYLGDQGRRLNMITQEMGLNKDEFPRLKERVGHRKIEVLVGGILGFALSAGLIELLKVYPITF